MACVALPPAGHCLPPGVMHPTSALQAVGTVIAYQRSTFAVGYSGDGISRWIGCWVLALNRVVIDLLSVTLEMCNTFRAWPLQHNFSDDIDRAEELVCRQWNILQMLEPSVLHSRWSYNMCLHTQTYFLCKEHRHSPIPLAANLRHACSASRERSVCMIGIYNSSTTQNATLEPTTTCTSKLHAFETSCAHS